MINKFSGEYNFLSNFYPVEIFFEGMHYPTVEHAYQASKTIFPLIKRAIQLCKTPGQVKRLGNKTPLRGDWEDVKEFIMETLVSQKFSNDPELIKKLVATGDEELVEGNSWGDTFWGVYNGVGRNNLGKILMKVRRKLLE